MVTVHDKITDEDLQALVDGAFDQETHRRMIHAIRHNPRLWRRLEELYYQKFILKEWWRSLPVA